MRKQSQMWNLGMAGSARPDGNVMFPAVEGAPIEIHRLFQISLFNTFAILKTILLSSSYGPGVFVSSHFFHQFSFFLLNTYNSILTGHRNFCIAICSCEEFYLCLFFPAWIYSPRKIKASEFQTQTCRWYERAVQRCFLLSGWWMLMEMASENTSLLNLTSL